MDLVHWERLYRTGAIAACPTTEDGGIDGNLCACWDAFFDSLPDTARVLDLATGNGALAGLAAAAARGRPWQIHACDAARIDPLQDVADAATRLAGIQFHPQQPNERLPFPDAHFDAVVGLYALEWGDTAATLAEVARALRPGAQAQFVLAHADAPMVQAAAVAAREALMALDELALFPRLQALLAEPLGPAAAQRAGMDVQSAIRTLKQALPAAQARGGGRMLALALETIRDLLAERSQTGPRATQVRLAAAEARLRDGARRIAELAENACDDARIAVIAGEAKAAGLRVLARAPVWQQGQVLVGWRLQLQRD